MVDEIITRQELIDAKRDARDLGKAVNEKVVVSPRYGDDFKSLPMIAEEFQISSDAAEAAAVTAVSAAQSASSSANIAEAAATAATIGAGVFETPEAGVDPVTGVADGAYFNVRSSSDESYVDEYQNVGGSAVATGKSYPSSKVVEIARDGVNTIADLLAIPSPEDGMRVSVKSYHAPTLFVEANPYKGGGTFVWDATSTATANNGTVFAINGVATGRWIRQLAGSEFITPQMFGAKADGVTDDYDAIVAAIDSYKGSPGNSFVCAGPTVFFPAGEYYLRDTLNLKTAVNLIGETDGQVSQPKTSLLFPRDKDGIIINRFNTLGPTGTVPNSTGADGARIEGFYLAQKNFLFSTARVLDYNASNAALVAESNGYLFEVGDIVGEYYATNAANFTATITSVTNTTHAIGLKKSPTPFQVGETIVGQTSGATAKVVYVAAASQALSLNNVTGTFSVNETIVGQTSGATAGVANYRPAYVTTVYGLSNVSGALKYPETADSILIKSTTYGTGILLRARAVLKNLIVKDWGRYGIAVIAGSDFSGTNANCFVARDIYINRTNLDGFFTAGSDANAGTIAGLNVVSVGGYGVKDFSFLGNHYHSCHVSAAQCGPYTSSSPNNYSVFSGCYSEGSGLVIPYPVRTSKIGRDSTVIGGDHGSGIALPGTGGYPAGYSYLGARELIVGANAFKIRCDASGLISDTRYTLTGLTGSLKLVHVGNRGAGRGVFFDSYLAYGGNTINGDSLDGSVFGGKYGVVWNSSNGANYEVHLAPSTSRTLSVTGGNPQTQALFNPIISGGVVTGLTISNPGAGYTSAPTITGSGAWTGLTATTEIFNGKVINVTVTASPTGLTSILPQLATVTELGAFYAGSDNTSSLGKASLRWSQVYAGTGTINTSDEREKQQIRDLSEAEKCVAVKLKSQIKAFKFNDAVAEKGDDARIHFGVIAQEVKAAFESEGLVAEDYAILCFDEWEAEYREITEEITVTNDAGEEVTETVETGERELIREAGNRYGVRYEELLAFIISAI